MVFLWKLLKMWSCATVTHVAQYFRFGDLIQPVEFSQRIENQARHFFIHEIKKSAYLFTQFCLGRILTI